MTVYKSKRRGVTRGPSRNIKRVVKRGGAKIAKIARNVVRQAIARTVETKSSNHTVATTNIYNNKIATIDTNLFVTSQGTTDPMVTDSLNRIGDEVNVRGLSIRFMMDMALNHSDVTFRAMIIKSAKGDTPTIDTLFCGLSPCKLLDNINTERYSVVFSKIFKMTARNMTIPGTQADFSNQTQGAGQGGQPPPSTGVGYLSASVNYNAQGKATRLMKIWIPGTKLFRNGVCKYENGSTQVKFFNYHFIVYSWSNSDANIDPAQNVINGLLKHYVCQMYFKDA